MSIYCLIPVSLHTSKLRMNRISGRITRIFLFSRYRFRISWYRKKDIRISKRIDKPKKNIKRSKDPKIWLRLQKSLASTRAVFILCGSGSSSLSQCRAGSGSGSGSRSRSSLTKFEEKKSWRVFLSCKNIKDCSKVRNNGACANLHLNNFIKLQLLAISVHFFSF